MAPERWRLLETWDADGAFHMGLDEALLLEGGDAPILRLYTWRPAALSLGYFQRHADVAALSSCDAVVRRMTGGGAIHHEGEHTLSKPAPLSHSN